MFSITVINVLLMVLFICSNVNQGDINFSDLVYIKPYCRIGPYLVGMGLGYLLHLQKGSTRKPHWVRRVNLYIYSPVVDTDLQIRGGGGEGVSRSSRPWDPEMWSKNKEEGVGAFPSSRFASALYCTECISPFVTTKHQQCRLVWVSVFECLFEMLENFH